MNKNQALRMAAEGKRVRGKGLREADVLHRLFDEISHHAKVIKDLGGTIEWEATPGEWSFDREEKDENMIICLSGIWAKTGCVAEFDEEPDENNAAYIAAANPARVIELLDRMEMMRNCQNCKKQNKGIKCVYCFDENGAVDYSRGWEIDE